MDYIPPTNIRRQQDYTSSDLENFSNLRWALKHVGIEHILFDGISEDCVDNTILIHVSDKENLIKLAGIIEDPKKLTEMGKFINRSLAVFWSQSDGFWFLIIEVHK